MATINSNTNKHGEGRPLTTASGLSPWLCVGDKDDEREKGTKITVCGTLLEAFFVVQMLTVRREGELDVGGKDDFLLCIWKVFGKYHAFGSDGSSSKSSRKKCRRLALKRLLSQ